MNDVYKGIIFGTVGIIISYIMITYGVPHVFPRLTQFQTRNAEVGNILDIGKKSVPLTMGGCNFDSSVIEINTSNAFTSGYVHLPQSNNLKGGVQFSYSFWLDTKSYNLYDLRDRIIFMRGINSRKYEGYDHPFIACPLVKFGNFNQANSVVKDNRNSYIDVIFNTIKKPHASVSLNQEVFDLTRSTNQNPRWFLITICFKDYIDFNQYERGIQIQSYINDNLVNTDVIKNDSLKVNNSNFYITPNEHMIDVVNTNSMYADITYYNYALSISEIEKIYKRGVIDDGACSTAKTNSIRMTNDNKYQRLDANNFL